MEDLPNSDNMYLYCYIAIKPWSLEAIPSYLKIIILLPGLKYDHAFAHYSLTSEKYHELISSGAERICWDKMCSFLTYPFHKRVHIVLPLNDFHMLQNLANTPRPTFTILLLLAPVFSIISSSFYALFLSSPVHLHCHTTTLSTALQLTTSIKYTHSVILAQLHILGYTDSSIQTQVYTLGYTDSDIPTHLYRLSHTNSLTPTYLYPLTYTHSLIHTQSNAPHTSSTMAIYNYLDMFLGLSLFAITTYAVPALILHWAALFESSSHRCCNAIANSKRGRLPWLITLTVATWFLAVMTHIRNISAAWYLMKVAKSEDGEKKFASGIIQTYLVFLVICSVLAFAFTSWFLWNNRRELPSLAKVIRYRAEEKDADIDLENGENDQWEMDTAHSEEGDPAGSGYGDMGTEEEDASDKWCRFCREYSVPGWTCSCDERNLGWSDRNDEGEDQHDWSRQYERSRYDNEGEDQHDWSRQYERSREHDWFGDDNEGEDNEGEGDHNWSRYDNEGANNEDEGEYQHDYPDSNTDNDTIHLTPSSSGSDAPVNTTTTGPPTFNNCYAPADDTESCSSCGSEHAKTIPWATPAAHREPLTPTSSTGYVAGAEDNDDGKESDISGDVTIGRSGGGDSETWNNEDRAFAYGSTPGQGFQREREDTGPLDQKPSNQTTSAQEQRPQPTGTAFPPHLAARDPRMATISADQTGHFQGPPVGRFRHGIAKPLRLVIPTQGITNAEPGAPTTPTNTYSLAQWPGTVYAGNSWRDV